MPCPELAEPLAAYRKFSDQLVEARIVDVGANQGAQSGDRAFGDFLPVPVHVADARIEESGPHEVGANDVVGSESGCKGVGGEHVGVAALDHSGRFAPAFDQPGDAGGYLLGTRLATPAGRRGGGEAAQVVGGVVVES